VNIVLSSSSGGISPIFSNSKKQQKTFSIASLRTTDSFFLKNNAPLTKNISVPKFGIDPRVSRSKSPSRSSRWLDGEPESEGSFLTRTKNMGQSRQGFEEILRNYHLEYKRLCRTLQNPRTKSKTRERTQLRLNQVIRSVEVQRGALQKLIEEETQASQSRPRAQVRAQGLNSPPANAESPFAINSPQNFVNEYDPRPLGVPNNLRSAPTSPAPDIKYPPYPAHYLEGSTPFSPPTPYMPNTPHPDSDVLPRTSGIPDDYTAYVTETHTDEDFDSRLDPKLRSSR